jgi:hypothetical protein
VPRFRWQANAAAATTLKHHETRAVAGGTTSGERPVVATGDRRCEAVPRRRSGASARCAEGAFGVDVASLSRRGRASAGRRTVLPRRGRV